MKRLLAVVCALMLAACGKASETGVEKLIETQMEKDGSKAKVDLAGGTVKVTTTDATGKISQMEVGGAKVTEADLGLPFYPGAKTQEGGMTRIASADGVMVTATLRSDDAPEKIAEFYRDKLKAASPGKQLTDMTSGDTQTMMLSDDGNKHFTQVTVTKADKGSDIQITAHKGAAK